MVQITFSSSNVFIYKIKRTSVTWIQTSQWLRVQRVPCQALFWVVSGRHSPVLTEEGAELTGAPGAPPDQLRGHENPQNKVFQKEGTSETHLRGPAAKGAREFLAKKTSASPLKEQFHHSCLHLSQLMTLYTELVTVTVCTLYLNKQFLKMYCRERQQKGQELFRCKQTEEL